MKSRIAVTLMLVFGMGLSTTGAGLAVTGSSGQGNAAQNVYPTTGTTPLNPQPTTTPQPTAVTPPAAANTTTPPTAPPAAPPAAAPQPQVAQGETPAPAPQEEQGDVRGVDDESAENAPVSPVRVADQAEVADTSAGDSLPFTGFSAIPVLLAGLALMVGGLFMHRRTSAGRL
jgi:uncharacterized membrane protein